jgi:hypothetical protein
VFEESVEVAGEVAPEAASRFAAALAFLDSTGESAKGLEWDVVHVISASDSTFPSDMVLSSQPDPLFSRGEEMSIPAPWLVAQQPPSIQRT